MSENKINYMKRNEFQQHQPNSHLNSATQILLLLTLIPLLMLLWLGDAPLVVVPTKHNGK